MNIFFLLAITLVLIVYMLRKHIPLGFCMLTGGLLIWAVRSLEPAALGQAGAEMLSLPRTYDIIFALYFVMCLEIELRVSGVLSGMVGALKRIFSSVRVLLAVMPAFLGLLPSLGGARFSAPMVGELAKGLDLSADHQSAINYRFRHLFEYSSPLIPGMIMACSIADVPFSAFLKHLSWLTPVAFAAGWFVLIRPIHVVRQDVPQETREEKRHEDMDLLLALSSVVVTFLMVVLFDFSASVALGLITFLLFFVLMAMRRFVSAKDIWGGALDGKMLVNVIGILYFIQLLSVTNVLTEIVTAFQAAPLPVPVIIACVSFIIGQLTGMSQGHVAIVMPIVAAMGTGNLNLAGVAMVFGVAGQMLTPTHLCLVVTMDYFKAGFFGTLKPILLTELMILTIFSVYTYFTWA